MSEVPKYPGDTESSSEEDKDSKTERKSFPPLVPRHIELYRDRHEAPAPAPRVPIFEQVFKDAPEKSHEDDDSDEDDDDEEKSEPTTEESEHEEHEDRRKDDLETEERSEAPSAEAAEEDPAPIVEREAESAEFEAAPPATALSEVVAEREEPASSEALPDEVPLPEESPEGVLYVRHEPEDHGLEAVAEPHENDEEPEPDPPHAHASSGGGTTPPPPPPAPPATSGSPAHGPANHYWRAVSPPVAQNLAHYGYNAAPTISVEQHKAEVKDAKERELRKGLVAGFITGYLVKAYLAKRKRERYEKAAEKQAKERDEQITHLQREQQHLGEKLARKTEEFRQQQEQIAKNHPQNHEEVPHKRTPEAPAAHHPSKEEEQHVFDQEGNEIILQPGWRVERSAGGYSVVLDERNRIVHDAIRYGEAFKRDQKREQLSEDVFAAISGPAATASDAGSVATSAVAKQQQVQQTAPPGQLPQVDIKHRLPQPPNQVVATVTSPWLWTAIAILIIVYFIAALA